MPAVGLQPLEDLLPVVQHHRGRVERERAVGHHRRVVPPRVRRPADRHHVVGEMPAESGVGQDLAAPLVGVGAGLGVRANCGLIAPTVQRSADDRTSYRTWEGTNGGLTTAHGRARPRTSTVTCASARHTVRVEQRQGDARLERRRERARRRDADARAVVQHVHARPRHPPAGRPQPAQPPRRPGRLLGHQRVAAPELRLAPAHRPTAARLHRGDLRREVLAVQRIAHLGAQGVAGAEPARARPGRHQPVPHLAGVVPRHEQLVAVLAGVPGAADPRAVPVDERHVVQLSGVPEHSGDEPPGPRPLHREHREIAVPVDHRDPGRRRRPQQVRDLRGVGGVGHGQHVVRPVQVDDHVVDHPAARVAAQRVLGLAGADLVQVGGEAAVHERRRARPGDRELAEVADVEHPDVGAHRRVLGDRAVGVGDGHRPAAERPERGAEGGVAVVQRAGQEVAHGRSSSPMPRRNVAAVHPDGQRRRR